MAVGVLYKIHMLCHFSRVLKIESNMNSAHGNSTFHSLIFTSIEEAGHVEEDRQGKKGIQKSASCCSISKSKIVAFVPSFFFLFQSFAVTTVCLPYRTMRKLCSSHVKQQSWWMTMEQAGAWSTVQWASITWQWPTGSWGAWQTLWTAVRYKGTSTQSWQRSLQWDLTYRTGLGGNGSHDFHTWL